ncbi:Ctr copper transporter [Trichoderma longibrachiatum ATCC 18648]|uniref:Copper transport protein n=1 Tax=Trichoderma longibrachiatum ATCC 18648 TaxID=983965 RepID=A0A2T4CIP1_TRILO|nr:Ctr copper transporter [Trichoderma longibrachiatum ATCC 18648]
MDHSHHMHAMEGHEGHGGHGGMQDMCSMNMLFTWDTTNLCIVFRQWHVRSTASLIFSLLAVVLLGIGYEALRSVSPAPQHAYRDDDEEIVTETPAFHRSGQNRETVSKRGHVIKATLYAIQNFYAFMLMLVFMTYNGWVMVAVSLGAFVGYLLFGHSTSATKDNACH